MAYVGTLNCELPHEGQQAPGRANRDDNSRVVASTCLETLEARAALLAALADPVRLHLIEQLADSGTRCVCNLQVDPPIAANLLSYHLKVLKSAGLVTAQKRGRWVDYTIAEDALERLHQALPTGAGSAMAAAGACRRGAP